MPLLQQKMHRSLKYTLTNQLGSYIFRSIFFMRKIIHILVACGLNIYFSLALQSQIVDVRQIRENTYTLVPTFMLFPEQANLPQATWKDILDKAYKLSDKQYGWTKLSTERDGLGWEHERWVQTYRNIPVEGSMYIVHSKAGVLRSVNGYAFPIQGDPGDLPNVSEEQALRTAYKVIQGDAEKLILRDMGTPQTRDRSSSSSGRGELVFVPEGGNYQGGIFRLAWKFDIYALEPLDRSWIYIDANTGNPIHKATGLHTIDTEGEAVTRYSGKRKIMTESDQGGYRLRESGRGKGIITWNMEEGTNFNTARDFTDDDNFWNNVNPQQDEAATDAHWGAEQFYDYLLQKFQRNSLDDNGQVLQSYLHFDKNYVNAFWDGRAIVLGDGDNTYSPFTVLDVVAHEFAHGLTGNTARLIYLNESGALNESFSDIFGKAVEYYARPENFSWRIGKELGKEALRDMENPLLLNHPKNYFGKSWFTGEADNGGVHINSGVQNHWFYLLVNGGEGINDFGDKYTVEKVGWDTAMAVAYRNLTAYLTPSSQYQDAQFFSIQAAIDLYGPCSKVHEAVTNAWYAVGIGKPYSSIPISNFTPSATKLCTEPYIIKFKDASRGVKSYTWDFGDGATSVLANPQHTFSKPGIYNVNLTITGLCGSNISSNTQSVLIEEGPTKPQFSFTPPQCGDSTLIIAQASGQVNWYDNLGNLIKMGDSLFTGTIKGAVDYFVRNLEFGPRQKVGPITADATGPGSYHNSSYEARIYFDVFQSLRLLSIWVDAGSAGKRNIILEDEAGNLLQTIPIDIPAGKQRIVLNLDLQPGSYRIGGQNMNLFRNNLGARYPYTIEDVISIRSAPPDAGANFYYYFYDWEIATFCAGPLTPVNIQAIPLATLSVMDTIVCVGESLTLEAPTTEGVVQWLSSDKRTSVITSRLRLNEISKDTTVLVRYTEQVDTFQVGPLAGMAIGEGSYHNTQFDARLFFEVLRPMRLISVLVDAGSAGERTIVLEDGAGSKLLEVRRELKKGIQRMPLNLDLAPGKYMIGGRFLDLYRNLTGAQFPYEIAELVRITGTNAVTRSDFYYYFYDWEVSEAVCESELKPVLIKALPLPEAQFESNFGGPNVEFRNLSLNSVKWNWDLGDGTTSQLESPSHTYKDTGTYVVRLFASNLFCTDTLTKRIKVSKDRVTSIDIRFDHIQWTIAPNPSTGKLRLMANFPISGKVRIQLRDMTGRLLWEEEQLTSAHLDRQLDLSRLAEGVYVVQLHTATGQWNKRVLLRR